MTVRVALLGCGYWGKNIARSLHTIGHLAAIVDDDAETAERFAAEYGCKALSLEEALASSEIDAVAIATPAATHYEVARAAMEAGKHVFVEKPMALRTEHAESLNQIAKAEGRVLMVGHLLQYHAGFLRLLELVRNGDLGRLQYLYSNRLNFGKIRREEDVLWSFAPHDISMILALAGEEPSSVDTQGSFVLHGRIADTTTTHLTFPSGLAGHIFVSWLHPFKEQKLVVIGEKAMAVFDDREPLERKLAIYQASVEWRDGAPVAPKIEPAYEPLPTSEPLVNEMQHFVDCCKSGDTPRTDGHEGQRVLAVLNEATEQLLGLEHNRRKEDRVVAPAKPGEHPGVHETTVVDDGALIGQGTKVWHFSHIMGKTTIGNDCSLGQNVVAGPNVTIGNGVRIQNNVSVYDGVTIEDDVFCGPSMVFTNVLEPTVVRVPQERVRTPTLVKKGAALGANCTIVCGSTIGEYAFVAAGAVVTKDVPAYALMMGVPARRVGWVSREGEVLGEDLKCPRTDEQYEESNGELRRDGRRYQVNDPIQLIDVKAHQAVIGEQIAANIAAVVEHGKWIMGPEVAAFETALEEFVGVDGVQALGCSNGTDALVLAMQALGLGPGAAVICPSFTFVATAEAVAVLGGVPVFADVEPDGFNISPDSVRQAVKAAEAGGLEVQGICAVDLFGVPAHYDELHTIAADIGAWVLADAAQAFGGHYNGTKVGGVATMTTTSFFPAKPLGCYGDGGAVFTTSPDHADVLRSLRVHGKGTDKYDNVRIGQNARLDTLQAAILLPKLGIFADELDKRDHVAARYTEGLAGVVATPRVPEGSRSAWAQYTIVTEHRAAIQAALGEEKIGHAVYYPKPLHEQTGYRGWHLSDVDMSRSDLLTSRVMSIPMHPYLTDDQIDRVVHVIRGAVAAHAD